MKLDFSVAECEELIREVVAEGGEFQLYPKGTSMLPLLHQGRDSVILVAVPKEIKRGDISLYKREDGSFVLHRVVAVEKDGTYTMCGDNQTELERGIKKEQMIAVVAAVCHGEKRISVKKLSYRAYSSIWRSFFIRKAYFKIRKLIKNK